MKAGTFAASHYLYAFCSIFARGVIDLIQFDDFDLFQF